MSEQTFDQQVVTQYLLGDLPEAEAEPFDELSVTNDEFAEALGAAEKDLVDAYVQGELTGAALEQFRSHYLASPLRREKVKFAQVFQVFAEQNAGTRVAGIQAESPAKSAPERKGGGWFAGLSAFFAPRFALQWGLTVAALALLIAGSWLAFENMRLRQQMSQEQARHDELLQREQKLERQLEVQRSANSTTEQELARVRDERERLEQDLKKAQQGGIKPSSSEGSIVSLILAPPLRGAGQVPTISIRPETNQVAAQLQLEAADYSAYRVALIDPAGNQTLWRSGSLKPRVKGERKALGVNFSSRLLKPQNYILRISGVSPNGVTEIVSDYSFKVVK